MHTEIAKWPTQHDSDLSDARAPRLLALDIGERFERGPGGNLTSGRLGRSPPQPHGTTDCFHKPRISVKERPWPKNDQPFTARIGAN